MKICEKVHVIDEVYISEWSQFWGMTLNISCEIKMHAHNKTHVVIHILLTLLCLKKLLNEHDFLYIYKL